MLPERLRSGYADFVHSRLPLERDRYRKLAETGQRPDTMVICCCDSRVSPEVIFDAHPGEMFVVRNIANLVPAYTGTGLTHGISAALEFAVEILGIKNLIVMGHTHCGGIRAFVEHRHRETPSDFIDNWMSMIASTADALDAPGDLPQSDLLSRLEQASVVAALQNLATYPEIKARVADGRLHLQGAYFDIGTGELTVHDPATNAFVAVPMAD